MVTYNFSTTSYEQLRMNDNETVPASTEIGQPRQHFLADLTTHDTHFEPTVGIGLNRIKS
jgi:hypothetical protein